MKKACFGLMIFCLALGLSFSVAWAEQPRLTLMIYMAGSDLESNASAASNELAEMMAAYPDSSEINVLVMASGSKKWQSDSISADETSIYELHTDGLEKVQTGSLRSMGHPDTLLSLLNYGYTNHPAEQYALILWDHGAGPMMGVCFDELFTNDQGMDGLTLPELESALAASPFASEKLRWIGFDACLMASIETASAVAPYAEYMIASQDTEPASGWDYAFLRDMAADSSAEDTARRIIDLYFDSVGDSMSATTLSLVDLSMIPAVEEAMNAFFGALSEDVDTDSYVRLTACRRDTRSLANASPVSYDLVDLMDLLSVYQDEGVSDCDNLVHLLRQAIVYNRTNTEFVNGLSVYYPYDNKNEYLSRWGRRAAETDFSPGYRAFLQDVSSIWLGDALADWNTGLYMESDSVANGTALSMQLTEQQAAHYGEARLYILEQIFPDEYCFLYMTDDVSLTQEDRLETVYTGQALFMVDDDGEPLTDAISYVVRDHMIFVPTILYSELIAGDLDMMAAYLVYQEDAQGEYVLSEVIEITDDPALQGRSAIRLEDWHELQFVGVGFKPSYNEAGRLEPYKNWTISDTMTLNHLIINEQPWRPMFCEQYGSIKRVALLEVLDNQNNAALVEMLPLENPNITPVAVTSQVLVDNEVCRITLTGAELVSGTAPGVHLFLHCENKTEGKLRLSFDQIAVDHTVTNRFLSDRYVDVGQENLQLDLQGESLQKARLAKARIFSMNLSAYPYESSYSSDALYEEHVAMDVPMDFSAAFTLPEPGAIWGEAAWNGLQMELLDLRLDAESAALSGQMRILNPTEEEIALHPGFAYLSSVLHYLSMDDVSLPAGYETYVDFEIETRRNLRGVIWPESVNSMLESLGIEEITELAFDASHGSTGKSERVAFQLTDPLPYPMGEAADWPVVYDRDGITINVIGSFTYPEEKSRQNQRYLYLLVSNDTDEELLLDNAQFPLFIDGVEMEIPETFFSTNRIPAHTTRSVAYVYASWHEETVSPFFTTFETRIGLSSGEAYVDTLSLRLDALGEPVQVTYTYPMEIVHAYIYSPDLLSITASSQP